MSQAGQSRSFVYSSLNRLRSASNPESGTTRYTYTDGGNLQTRTDARVVSTTFGYDALQRIRTKNYSDTTPDVTYAYYSSGTPNVGQLQSITSSAATSSYGYDPLGRVLSQSQTITGHPDTFTFTNTYFLTDALKSQEYPSGRMVTYAVDDAGRVESVTSGTTDYAARTAYTADGRMSQTELGNGLWETRDYRPPGMPTLFKLGTAAGTSERLKLGYDYHATQNNGNLTGHTITRPGRTQPWTQTFGYDAVNRLLTASETDGYSRSFGYDRYGNRWVASNSGMTYAESHEPLANVFNAATNRMNTTPSIGYDGAGNQTKYSPWELGYDAENRIISITKTPSMPSVTVGEGTYAYDGEGRRVKKVWTPPGVAAEETYFVYDPAGNLAAEYGTGPASASGTAYLFADMLGSVRAVTDADGVVQECYDHLPFGRLLSASDNGRDTLGCHPASPDSSLDSRAPQKFTGQVRDEETRLDYFGARYFSGPEGRFLSPDAPFLDQDGYSPQSWNLYAYVRNNPLSYSDPSGTKCVELDNGSFADDGAGGGCEETGVDADGNIQPYGIEVTAEKGNIINSVILNTLFAADALAQAYFEPLIAMIGVRPSYMEPIPASTDYTGTVATAGVFLGSIFLGPGSVANSVRATEVAGLRGFVKHGVDQAITRGVRSDAILDAIKHPLVKGPVKIDQLGRPSQRFVGREAEVVVNPHTRRVISVNPTSTRKAERLGKQQGQ